MNKKHFISLLVLVVIFLVSLSPAVAYGPSPSWELTQGAANSCVSSSGFGIPNVQINALTPASEHGVLSYSGGALGETHDMNFTGVITTTFFVFVTTPYSLPANTQLTLTVTTYNAPLYAGGVAYVSTITWNCTTGELVVTSACPYPLATSATIRNVPLGAPAYYAADLNTLLPWSLPAGNWYVSEISGDFAKVWIACTGNPIWIPVSALG